jgi:hypothetical protein
MSNINSIEARLNTHEEVCAERYLGINARLKRLEQILLCSCGFIMVTLISIVLKLH